MATAKALLFALPPTLPHSPTARATSHHHHHHWPAYIDIDTDHQPPGHTAEDRAFAATRGGGTGGSLWETWEGRRPERRCLFGGAEGVRRVEGSKRGGNGIG